jgi:hypothetical protein
LAYTPLAPLSAGVLVAALLASALPAAGSNWAISLAAGAKAEAQAQGAPAAPTGISDVCVSPSGRTVTVSWNAVTDASTYSIFKSTTTSAGTYTSAATGVTTASWTSGTLTAGNYWFKVEAYVGTKWVSAQSAATPSETTIATTGTECQQP